MLKRKCSRCGVQKPVSEFSPRNDRKSGYDSRCRECGRERGREYNATEKGRLAKRARHLRLTYGMTLDDYDDLLDRQDGVCGICGRNPRLKRLFVDHDHKTGKIRGALCGRCNQAIGHLGDNLEGLLKAVRYLENAEGE